MDASMIDLPEQVAELAKALTAMPGAVAVAFGGSRALGVGVARSDWDFGLYYRGTIDLAALTAWGTVHPPGSWGRLLNGGAAARAVLEEANAVLCESGRWVCNEKRSIKAAGLTDVQPLFEEIPSEPVGLVLWVDLVAGQLGVPTSEVLHWRDAARGAEPGAAVDRGRT